MQPIFAQSMIAKQRSVRLNMLKRNLERNTVVRQFTGCRYRAF